MVKFKLSKAKMNKLLKKDIEIIVHTMPADRVVSFINNLVFVEG